MIPLILLISGRGWEADLAAIYGDPAHFNDLRVRLGSMIPAAVCRLLWRGDPLIECVYFMGVPAHLHYKGILSGGWLGSPPCFPMLFRCFSLGFSDFPVG